MSKHQMLGMQHDSLHGRHRGILFPAVGLVTEQRVSKRFKMNPDLMRPSRVNSAAHQRGDGTELFLHGPVGFRRPTTLAGRHAMAMHGVPANRTLDRTAFFFWHSGNE